MRTEQCRSVCLRACATLLACAACLAALHCSPRPAPTQPQAQDWYRKDKLFASFDPDARDLSLLDAYLLELACYIGDRGTFEVDRTLQAWGFDRRRDFRDINTSTYGYVASNDRMVLVTFGGTDFMNARDLLSDVDALQLVYDDRYCATPDARVHRGFRDSLNSVMDGVIAEVRTQAAPTRATVRGTTRPTTRAATTRDSRGATPPSVGRKKLFIAGHSRGGAFAVLAAVALGHAGLNDESLPDVAGVYTFGQPRVGNEGFFEAYAALGIPLYRFINRDDPIPGVPPAGLIPQGLGLGERLSERVGYQHGGVAVRLLADGRVARGGSNDPQGPTLSDLGATASSINQHYQPGYHTAIYQALTNPQLIGDPGWRAAVTPQQVAALPRPVQ
jgi:hypothetical protein